MPVSDIGVALNKTACRVEWFNPAGRDYVMAESVAPTRRPD